jgi:redox-sensitive bicupin YhaK (pirin superfamily)
MIRIRPSHERGHTRIDWLNSQYTFSFADYYDPEHMGFRRLRVLNEDWIEPGAGFGTHPHRDAEIITYVLAGALEHKDSMGNGSVIRPGEVQRMSAGTGITHSEYNHSKTELVHLLQIWILPERSGIQPSYEQKAFPLAAFGDRLLLVTSRDGRDGSLTIHQDVDLYAARMAPGRTVTHRLRPERHAWLQVAGGNLIVNREHLGAGDGAALSNEQSLEISAESDAEFLLFDLA